MSDQEKRLTLGMEATATLEEKKSIFIACAAPVTSEEEARAHLENVRHRYADANHHVYAYLLRGGSVARYSDDAEPQGTAGIPVLNVLKMSGASDLCVVVARYFGGTLLGAGGLVRAYSGAAKLAIAAAGIVSMELFSVCSVECSYTNYQKLTAHLPKLGAIEEDAVFFDRVSVTVVIEKNRVAELEMSISEMSGGKAVFQVLREEERPSRVK